MNHKSTIKIRISDAGGCLLRTADLAPLLPPIGSVVADIKERGGPEIVAERIVYEEQSFPVFEIDGRPIACVMRSERTLDETEARWLWAARRRSLSDAFQDLSSDRWRTIDRLGNSPSLARAALVLTGAFETAILAARTGSISRKVGEFVFGGDSEDSDAPSGCDAVERSRGPMHPVRGTVH